VAGTEIPSYAEKSYAKAHNEPHTKVTGAITVGDEDIALDAVSSVTTGPGKTSGSALSA
jgi:hypothetical protein